MHNILNDWELWGICTKRPSLDDFTVLSGGFNNECFLLRADDKQYVLRLEGKNSKALDVNRQVEYRLHQWLSEHNLVPVIRYRDEANHYWIREYVEGITLTTEDLTFERVARMLEYLERVHALAVVDIPTISISEKAEHFWALIFQHSKNEELFSLKNECQKVFAGLPSAQKCLCHMDPIAANWVETNTGDLVLLDWEYAAIGHPYWDMVSVLEYVDEPIQERLLAQFKIANQEEWLFAQQQMRYLSAIWYRAQNVSTDAQLVSELRAALQ